MKKFKFTIRGNEYDVLVKSFEDGVAKVEVNGSPYQVEVEKTVQESKTPIIIRQDVKNPRYAHKIRKSATAGITKVIAPLPGRWSKSSNWYLSRGQCTKLPLFRSFKRNLSSFNFLRNWCNDRFFFIDF